MTGADADADFAAWFRLLETPGVGRTSVRRWLASCGTPAAVLAAAPATLRAIAGPAAADALARPFAELPARLEAARRWLAGGSDRHAITVEDPAFPPQLLQTADPPLMLYVRGRPAVLATPAVAIVGSRHATPQGLDNARAFSAALGRLGYVVVSGLARGIDAAAHEGALGAEATTVAVVGTGLDSVYPAAHQELARRIARQGALVSEYPPGTPPLPEHFPQRNRIIAGLTQGTLVVEAALKSGSLITARLASEAGREVFAIPGSIHAPQARGCHALLRQGAKLVESAADIVEELQNQHQPARPGLPPAPSAPAVDDVPVADHPLLDALGHDPVTLDALMARTGWPASALTAALLELELEGRASRLPGGLYQRRFAG